MSQKSVVTIFIVFISFLHNVQLIAIDSTFLNNETLTTVTPKLTIFKEIIKELVNNDTKINAPTTSMKDETIKSTSTTTETSTSTKSVVTTEETTTTSVFSLTTIPNQSPKRVDEQIIGKLSSFKAKFDQNEAKSTTLNEQETVNITINDSNFNKTTVFVENSTVYESTQVVLNTSTPVLTTTATEKMIIESPEVYNNTVVDTTMTPVTSTATASIQTISNITTTTTTTFASTNVESILNNKKLFLSTTPTSSSNYKRYRFCSLFYSGIVCKDTYLSNNDEDKVVIGDDVDEVDDSDDEDDGFSDDDQVVIGVPSSLPAPPYLNNVNNDPDRFSQFYKGFFEEFSKL